MNATTLRALALAAGLGLTGAGCGPRPAPPPAPLTVDEWKALPADQKYTPETIERLKDGDPQLQTPEGWERFSRTVVAEARKKDFPKGKR